MHSYLKKSPSKQQFHFSPFVSINSQGDPIQNNIVACARLRWLLAAVLLVGIVISNAYKNNNVYNMVQPRKQIPCETIEELVSRNFTIYTRVGEVEIANELRYHNSIERPKISQELHEARCKFGRRDVHADVCITSEISRMKSRLGSKAVGGRFEHFMKISKMHEAVSLILQNLLDSVSILYTRNFSDYYNMNEFVMIRPSRIVHRIEQLFMERQQKLVYSELLKCQQTALIAPQYVCKGLLSKVQDSKGHVANIGKENFGEFHLGINLYSHVYPFARLRLKGLVMSGLFHWWMKYILQEASIKGDAPLEKPSMKGNIVIIFMILTVGLGLSLCAYFVEIRYKLWKRTTCVSQYLILLQTITDILFRQKENY